MTKLAQAARQALEALEVSTDWDICAKGKQFQSMKAITALREALMESNISDHKLEQEPVAWGRVFDGDIIDCICPEEHALNEGDYTIPLYTHPVRTKDPCHSWQDLTDDEIEKAFWGNGDTEIEGCRAVIAADREKNKC